jgi:hypothetical protein
LTVDKAVPDSAEAEKKLLFLPGQLTDGIEESGRAHRIASTGRWMQPALVCFGSWQTKISLVPISRSVRHKIRVAVQPPFWARNVC